MESEYLLEKSIKPTKHNKAILALFKVYNHLDAQQIVNFLSKKKVRISLATVYRILAKFENAGIISKLYFNNEQSTYELLEHRMHHDHLICIRCQKVIEFVNQEIENLQIEIAKKNNFIIMHHSLNIYGICASCNHNN